jgi:hypothetical protein
MNLVPEQTQVFLAVVVFFAYLPGFGMESGPSSSIFRARSAEHATFGMSS